MPSLLARVSLPARDTNNALSYTNTLSHINTKKCAYLIRGSLQRGQINL